jgi:uncharacterized membrane protein YcjF (UPF0283 family)
MFSQLDASSLSKYVGKKIGRQPLTNRYVQLGVAVGIAASVGFIAREVYRLIRVRRQAKESAAHVDAVHDKALKGSFPASDPPASQFFDIPVNRQ